jgi:hypothetical protein
MHILILKTTSNPQHDLSLNSAEKSFRSESIFDNYLAGFRPPISARALGYLGLIAYESITPGLEQGQSIVATSFLTIKLPQIEKTNQYHWGVRSMPLIIMAFEHIWQGLLAKIITVAIVFTTLWQKKWL